LGEYGHQLKDIYRIPSEHGWVEKHSKQDIGSYFKGLQIEKYKDLG
jgi:hypothetical protein